MALLGLHGISVLGMPCALRLSLIKGSSIRKELRKIRKLRGYLLQGNIFLTKARMSTLQYYKNPETLTNQGMHNSPSFGTLEL